MQSMQKKAWAIRPYEAGQRVKGVKIYCIPFMHTHCKLRCNDLYILISNTLQAFTVQLYRVYKIFIVLY